MNGESGEGGESGERKRATDNTGCIMPRNAAHSDDGRRGAAPLLQ
jgi:hypothetical protein